MSTYVHYTQEQKDRAAEVIKQMTSSSADLRLTGTCTVK